VDDTSWDLLRLALSSLRKVSTCSIVIFTNEFTTTHAEIGKDIGNLHWEVVDSYMIEDRMMLFKVEALCSLLSSLQKDDQVLCVDADTYFCSDPFEAFSQSFDIGLTARHYEYQYPINAGVVFVRVNPDSVMFFQRAIRQIKCPTWHPYLHWRERFKRSGVNWYVDQDYYNVAYLNRDSLPVNIKDVGYRFNFCPHADGDKTEQGKDEMMEAYFNGDAVVLHFKSRLKELILEGLFNE
jgi:hypothetical protein